MLAVFGSRGNGEKGQEPGAPMRAVAQVLTERGFEVRHWEHEESRRLTVTGAGSARCEIDVYDADGIRWEYFAGAGRSAEPAEISGVVRRLLDADKTAPGTHLPRMDTLKGAVACEMRARGLKADLEAFEDHEQYDVLAEVVLTNPAKPERGMVRIDDDGVIRWEYDYGEIPASLAVIADATADVLGEHASQLSAWGGVPLPLCCASPGDDPRNPRSQGAPPPETPRVQRQQSLLN